MHVLFCWRQISGYMAACWRALDQMDDVQVSVLAYRSRGTHSTTDFADSTVEGLDCRLLNPDERDDAALIKRLVQERQPDVLVLCGWKQPAYRALAFDPALRDTPMFLAMDTQYQGTWRQWLAPFVLRRFLRRISTIIVAGERTWQYARHLGFREEQIARGVYGCDQELFHQAAEERANDWPRRFLFVGRYVHAKGLQVLSEAYRTYCETVNNPWALTTCGSGPLADQLDAQPGVDNKGFVQPCDLPPIFTQSGAFVLPSLYEPWGVVIAEAAAAGLPVICSEACGAGVDLVQPYYSGIKVATNNSEKLADAFRWMHENEQHLPQMGRRAQQLAGAYTAEVWARRWRQYLLDAVGS